MHDRIPHSGLTQPVVEDVLRSLFPEFRASPGSDDFSDVNDFSDFDDFEGIQSDFCVEVACALFRLYRTVQSDRAPEVERLLRIPSAPKVEPSELQGAFAFWHTNNSQQLQKDEILRHKAHSLQRPSSRSSTKGSDAEDLYLRSHDSYKIGIICALDVEFDAIHAILDEEHPSLDKLAGDENTYVFGRIYQHPVVVACASTNTAGSATLVAKDMMRSFDIKAGFSVGLGNGVWSEETDVRLGDVIVSQPDKNHGGVVQWDFDAYLKHGNFRFTGMLNRPPDPLFEALRRLNAQHLRRGFVTSQPLTELLRRLPEWRTMTVNRCDDKLFASDYRHTGGRGCGACDVSRIITRSHVRATEDPRIHYGNIASSFGVPQDAMERDRIARDQKVICFETEAAGLMNTFPCVLIRGVSSYGDSHKNDTWQSYAAGAAACYTKDLIRYLGGPCNYLQGYRELDYSRHQTRFLQICRGRDSEDISCTMSIGSPLEENYLALSYSWGDHKFTDHIIVNRVVRQVTKSLKSALIELRRRSVVKVWIDALCIDQNDPNEKTYQLRQMDSIFHRASKVISWLGPATNSSDLAMQQLNDWRNPAQQPERQALLALFRRAYWQRAWIIQEVAKASEVEVWCGSKRVKWGDLIAGVKRFLIPIPQSLSVLQAFCDAERASQAGQSAMLLSTAMIRTMHTRATFPLDRVYALINLSRDGRTMVPFPSYDRPEAEVFDSILRRMIIAQGRLDFLFFAGSWKKGRVSPSWLPSWHQRPREQPPNQPFCTWLAACFNRDPGTPALGPRDRHVTWDQETDALIVDAQIIGTLGDAAPDPPSEHHAPIATVLFVVCRRLLACQNSQHLLFNHPLARDFQQNDFEALMHLWSDKRITPKSTASRIRYPMLSCWYRDHGSISYRGVSLRDVVDRWTTEDMRHAAVPQGALLDQLEVALGAMSVNSMKMMTGFDRLPVAIVPQDTKAGDCIVWLRQTSLLAVLRPEEGGKFSVVGEVVDTPERLGLSDRRDGHADTPWKQITLI